MTLFFYFDGFPNRNKNPKYQQEAGQSVSPLSPAIKKQHCPLAATHNIGPPHSAMAIRVIPAAPATPTSPRPPSTGAIPPAPIVARAPAAPAAPAPTALLATPLTARRAKPPATTGKFTENKIINLLMAGIIFAKLKGNI